MLAVRHTSPGQAWQIIEAGFRVLEADFMACDSDLDGTLNWAEILRSSAAGPGRRQLFFAGGGGGGGGGARVDFVARLQQVRGMSSEGRT